MKNSPYFYLGILVWLCLLCGCSTTEEPVPEDQKEEEEESQIISWPNPTPPLHVEGRFLKDPCGNSVNLHGVAMTPSPWFNGGHVGEWRWNNYDVQGCLNYNKSVMDKLSTGDEDGWYLNYVRLHIDPYWSNTPGEPIPENDISRFDFDRFVTAVDEVIVPLVDHAKSRGMYLIIRPPGVCPHEIAVGDDYYDYLMTIWDHVSQHPDLKNTDHVMFELANEPVQILGTNGEYGSDTPAHYEALQQFFQPMVNKIRENGAENILWIPGSGYQSHYRGFADYPIEGENIGYAVHLYPGYWGQDLNDPTTLRQQWERNFKPVADFAPIAVTEIDWAPEQYDVWGKGGITGTANGWGFGANFKLLADETGNVSWNLLAPENLIDRGDPEGGIAFGADPDACAKPVHEWFREYAEELELCEGE